MIKRLSITISGKVQGVGFRYFAQRNAAELKLVGYVKNIDYDKVEIVAEGDEKSLNEFLERCRKGPRWGRVDNVVFDYDEATDKFLEFVIK